MHTVCTRRLEQEAAIGSENHLHMYYWKTNPSIQYVFTVCFKRVMSTSWFWRTSTVYPKEQSINMYTKRLKQPMMIGSENHLHV